MASSLRSCEKLVVLILTAFFVLLMPSVLLRAESVVICGVPFKVESLSDIDRFTVKVGLFGETKLVARDSLEKLIVKTYFSETAQGGSLTPQAMKQFIVECLSAGIATMEISTLKQTTPHRKKPPIFHSCALKETVSKNLV